MTRPPYDSTGIEICRISSFTFTSGENLPIDVAYRSYNPESSKKACIPTCYGGRINTTLTFTDKKQALSSYHVIVVAMLGNGESSSPSNTPNFPKKLDYRDCIHAQYELLTKQLGFQSLDVIQGFSMGGQQACYWACMYPDFVKNVIVTCGSAKTSGHNYTFLEGPTTALMNSIDYLDGKYKAKNVKPLRGLQAFGRAYCAWLTSGAWFRERLWEKKLGFGSIEDYIENTESTFQEWDAEDLLILARMWQAGDIGTTREDGDYLRALEDISARMLIMPSRTDQYFQVADSEIEMNHLKKGEFAPIDTVWGHVAGGALASLPHVILSQLDHFDIREATIEGIHNALYGHLTTCRAIVESFIARVEAYNPLLDAIITLNPNALSLADEMDLSLAAGNVTGSLFCIPVLLKDNYDTADMPTTGGCLDLAGSQPTVDAPVVTALKDAGAIILGKTNLHELALEGLSVSSLGGQTANPYDTTRTPGGSSGGTGAAIAASFAVFGTGTDTVNSLRSPASANSLFSVRPTRGLISRAGIIPISFTQDAVGPIGRNIDDLAIALTVMASVGYDLDDNVTALIPKGSMNVDYSAAMHGSSLKGMRLGLVESFFNRTASNETSPVTSVIDDMVVTLTAAGASVVPINEAIYNSTAISNMYDTQRLEYRQEMDTYLSRSSLHGQHPSTLQELYSSGKYLVIPSQYSYVNTALVSSTDNATYAVIKSGIQNLTIALETTFKQYSLDALIYPEQSNLVVKIGSSSQYGRNGILAAATGFPVVTVPAGFSPPNTNAPIGVPIGMEILGMPWTEARILGLAKQISEVKRTRRMPESTQAFIESRALQEVPKIVPNRKDIPKVYPIGVR
ncbi:hypothetical protein ACLMJK_002933 [Lecanora helva]